MDLTIAENRYQKAKEYVQWVKNQISQEWKKNTKPKFKDFQVCNEFGFKCWLREQNYDEQTIQAIWSDALVQTVITDELMNTIIKRGVRKNSVELLKMLTQQINDHKNQMSKEQIMILAENDSKHSLIKNDSEN